jgi:pimeloyl-ACP methyl ester carboxylesterase
VNGRLTPLETDLTVPLGYFLDSPEFKERDISTLGLLKPDQLQSVKGLYMLEPYDPQRIPVVMVHGLWSSPTTWMEMFNDLRAFPEIRRKYQFWFYLYPTGQPFWESAAQLREALAQLEQDVNPASNHYAFNQMVLVGHSMGGLLSYMQSIESGQDFWRILSDKPFEQLQGDAATRDRLARIVYFRPNPSVKCVVTIGTPHRGSDFANDAARWAGRAFIQLPEMMVQLTNRVARENPGLFRDTALLTTSTSIDSLSPQAPIFQALSVAQRSPYTSYYNIVGILPESFANRFSAEGDGVVAYKNAQLPGAAEFRVPADHTSVHRHSECTLHVRQILLQHWHQSRMPLATWEEDISEDQPHYEHDTIRLVGAEEEVVP